MNPTGKDEPITSSGAAAGPEAARPAPRARQFGVSLRVLLTLSLVGLQLFAVVTVVLLINAGTDRALMRQSTALLQEIGSGLSSQIKSFLAPARQAVDLSRRLVVNGALDPYDDRELESHLFRVLQNAPQLSGIYLGRTDGSFVMVMRTADDDVFRTKIIDSTSPGAMIVWRNSGYATLSRQSDPDDSYDPRTRPWFISAAETFQTIWTDPYIFFTSQRPGLTLATPVFDEGGLIGVFGVDIQIDAIAGFLDDTWASETGAAMILTKSGDVIAHPGLTSRAPDPAAPPFLPLSQLDDPVAQAAFGGLFAPGAAPLERVHIATPTARGQDDVAIAMPIKDWDLPWLVAVHAPQANFTGEISAERASVLWLAFLVVALSSGLGVILANRIGQPVQAFATLTGRVSRGEAAPGTTLTAPYKELVGTSETLLHEISQRRHFQAAYGRTFDLSSRGMAQLDPDTGRFLHVNARLSALLGHSEESLLDMGPADLMAEGRDTSFASLRSAIEGESEFATEAQFRTAAGGAIWLRMSALLIHDAAGEADHVLAIFDDVTDARHMRDHVDQLKRDLSHAGRVNAMGEFAAGLAHELNQPLSAMVHDVDSARMVLDESGAQDAEMGELLDDIEKHAHRAGDIIRALRNVVRKDKGQLRQFDLGALVRQTVALVEPEARESGTRLAFAGGPSAPVMANRTQIAQVIVNLVSNAMEALEHGGSPDPLITVRLTRDGPNVVLEVEDNGPGVPEGMALFTQFETSKDGGLGLGLSICRSILEANGGGIRHEAAPPHGARFIVALRAAPDDPQGGAEGGAGAHMASERTSHD